MADDNDGRFSKFFTVEEAREALEDIEPKVREILEIKHDLDAKGFDLSSGQFTGEEPDEVEKKDIEARLRRVQRLLNEIHEGGALYKDPRFEIGTVDFPHMTDEGETVFLCWMEGEDTVEYWHPIETGMSGREPLETLKREEKN